MRAPEVHPANRLPPEEDTRPFPAGSVAPGYPEAVVEADGIKEALAVLRRHWLLIAVITAAAVAVSGYLLYTAPPLYRARAVLRLVDERRALTGGIEDAALERVAGVSNDPLLSQIQVLRSRAVVGEVVDRLGLRLTVPDGGFSAGLLEQVHVGDAAVVGDTIRASLEPEGVRATYRGRAMRVPYGTPVEVAGVSFVVRERPREGETDGLLVVRSRDDVAEAIATQLRVRPRERTDVIDVEFIARDPVRAQRLVNTTAEVFREMNVLSAQRKSRSRREFVEEQLVRTDSVLTEAQVALSAFQTREQVFSSSEKFATEQQGLMELEVRREEMDADRRTLESLLATFERGRGPAADGALRALVSSPGLSANPVITQIYAQLTGYERARDSLTAGAWGSVQTNPDVERYNTLIASARGNLASAVRSHIDQLTARITSLDQLRGRNAAKLTDRPRAQAEEARLVQRVATMQEVSEQLREEYQRARIAEAVEAGQVEIVDLAARPRAPENSGRRTKLLLSLVLGLILGGGAAFLVEHLNTTIQRREELESVLQVSSLAVIPQIGPDPGKRGRGRHGVNANGNGKGHLPVDAAGAMSLVTVSDMRSSGAEAYRTLRTNLIFSQSLGALRTLVVTSAAPGDGKTTTASNLAVAFAQHGMRVALVDCDLRRPRIDTLFEVPKEPGLTQLVLRHNPVADVLRATPVEGLFVIPSGTQPPNPSELLGGEQMRAAMALLSEQFDLVVLDTPPLLAAADAAILGSFTDGVILVVRAGKTEKGGAQQAKRQLNTVGAKLLGAVLNDPDAKMARYGEYGYYSYYGHYGSDEPKKKKKKKG